VQQSAAQLTRLANRNQPFPQDPFPSQATVPQPRTEAADCGRKPGAGCVGGTGGAGTRGERQPSIRLAAAISARIAAGRERNRTRFAGGADGGSGSRLQRGADATLVVRHDSGGTSPGAVARERVCRSETRQFGTAAGSCSKPFGRIVMGTGIDCANNAACATNTNPSNPQVRKEPYIWMLLLRDSKG
jgi:hypothetical protein